jgi:hypothetical protein
MAGIDETLAYLRITGDQLVPDEITAALGSAPSSAGRKGDVDRQRVAKTGTWVIDAAPSKPSDLDRQIAELLAGMTDDLSRWRGVTDRFDAMFCCSAFMVETNEGAVIAPTTLRALGERGISLGLDIYAPSDMPK